MKNLFLLLFATLYLFTFNGCTEDEVTYDIDIPIPAFILDGPLVQDTEKSVTQTVTTNIEAALNQFDASLEDVESITIKELTLTITSPSGTTFGIFDYGIGYMQASGLPEIKVVFKDQSNFDGSTSSLFFDLTFEELKEYFTKSSIDFRAVFYNPELITNDIGFEGNIKVSVKVKKDS